MTRPCSACGSRDGSCEECEMRPQTCADLSLTATLRALGWSHYLDATTVGRAVQTHEVFDASGAFVASLTAHETWGLLRERGLVRS